MTTCDVLVVGGGPAGSACAWSLRRAGADVLVVDARHFPRHKACAGWITPPVFAALGLSAEEYGAARSLQPITGFRTSVAGERPIETHYDHPVSWAIRRTEFDAYLLQRSGARLELGCRIDRLRKTEDGWVVNERFLAPVLVGAGGHFCPVARALNPPSPCGTIVSARVVEFTMDGAQAAACVVDPRTPEIFLEPDLRGYGWVVRKGNVLNVGFGRIGGSGISERIDVFVTCLRRLGRLPSGTPLVWPGHAYLLRETTRRNPAGDRVLLVGDAAGLARGCTGEGIRPAIESGQAAAETVIAARSSYDEASLDQYRSRLEARLGPVSVDRDITRLLPAPVRAWIARRLLASRHFTRRVLLDQWLAVQPATDRNAAGPAALAHAGQRSSTP